MPNQNTQKRDAALVCSTAEILIYDTRKWPNVEMINDFLGKKGQPLNPETIANYLKLLQIYHQEQRKSKVAVILLQRRFPITHAIMEAASKRIMEKKPPSSTILRKLFPEWPEPFRANSKQNVVDELEKEYQKALRTEDALLRRGDALATRIQKARRQNGEKKEPGIAAGLKDDAQRKRADEITAKWKELVKKRTATVRSSFRQYHERSKPTLRRKRTSGPRTP